MFSSLTLLNLLLACVLNITFMIAGIILNSVVIISLWRSEQLRRKLCYFMILVLSCFDLTVVAIIHPVITLSTIIFSLGNYNELLLQIVSYTSMLLQGFSMFALLTLNIERFLGISYPLFHRASVTRKRLMFILASSIFFTIILSTLSFRKLIIPDNLLVTICMSTLLSLFVLLNWKMIKIARSKCKRNKVVPSSKVNFKKASTCSLTVWCLIICASPEIVLSSFCLAWKIPLYDEKVLLFTHWIVTIMAMNSTFNCLIFFWRNAILHRVGIKMLLKVFPFSKKLIS